MLKADVYRALIILFFHFPEFYHHAGISAEAYQKELEYQLRKTTLGISVGLVKEPSTQVHPNELKFSNARNNYFNPYSHFSREVQEDRPGHKQDVNNLSTEENNAEHIHEYKICEIRPPSIEKVKISIW